MANRRMFAKQIIDTDMFLSMPLSAQALYFHLNMKSDDEGFVGNPKATMRLIGASEDDMKILLSKQFLIPFDTGVVVIKHWKIHNYIRGDRLTETTYTDEKSLLIIDKKGQYNIKSPELNITGQSFDSQMSVKRLPNDSQVSAKCQSQVRLGKDRLGKDSIGENIYSEKPAWKKTPTVLSLIEEYTEDEVLKNLLKEFQDMRTKKKKPLTVRAIKMALNELDKLQAKGEDKKKVVEQTLYHCWDSFYPVKDSMFLKQTTMQDDAADLERRMAEKGFVVSND